MPEAKQTTFCTAVNCIDGRVQIPVIEYLRETLDVDHVDVVTEPGAVAVLADGADSEAGLSIRRRVDVSLRVHGSKAVAVVAHQDCAGNPVPDREQRGQLQVVVPMLATQLPGVSVLGLWVGVDGTVNLEARRDA